jgi:hypothetical protein
MPIALKPFEGMTPDWYEPEAHLQHFALTHMY